jgi:hypothetical protein
MVVGSLRVNALNTSRRGGFRGLSKVASSFLGSGELSKVATSFLGSGEAAPTTARKPIILLDVDGVINMLDNPYNPIEKREWGSDIHITSAYNPERDMKYGLTYSKEMVRSINAWNKVAEVQWLTAWCEAAQTSVAPALGLDHFECARTYKQQTDLDEEEKAKTAMRIAKYVGKDTLIIWIDDHLSRFIDDNNDEYAKKDLAIFKRPNTLLICPPGLLTRANIELVNACVADPVLWRGKHLREGCREE